MMDTRKEVRGMYDPPILYPRKAVKKSLKSCFRFYGEPPGGELQSIRNLQDIVERCKKNKVSKEEKSLIKERLTEELENIRNRLTEEIV